LWRALLVGRMTSFEDSPDLDESTQGGAQSVNPRDVRVAAMDLLARREHLQRELQLKLNKRFAADAVIADVLLCLQEEGLQSDWRFCESYLRMRSGRGYGPERIQQELRQKGAPAELVALAFESCEIDWLALARSTRSKKFGDETPADYKAKSKQLRFLQYRGFAGDILSRALPDGDDRDAG
jgi:regulatory protein